MSLIIKLATYDDLEELLKIENLLYPFPWSLQHFQSELEKSYSHFFLLMNDESDILAYIVAWMVEQECEILNLAVSPQFQRRGMGTVMIQKMISIALKNGIHRIRLNVRKSNTAAIYFYQNIGFSIQHIRKNFYSNSEDAYEMILPFNSSNLVE